MTRLRELIGRALPSGLRHRLRDALHRRRPASHGPQWQHRRLAGTERRWALIADALTAEDHSLLDIGCNAGMLTAKAAADGLLALGIDANEGAIGAAREAYGERPRLAFMVHEIDREGIARLPRFDVVLLLSVYHQWVAGAGEDVAERMLRDVVGVARHRVMFETAGVARKYGDHVPDRLAAAPDEIVEYVSDLLGRVSPPGARVRHLGPTPTPDDDELVRHLFSIDLTAS